MCGSPASCIIVRNLVSSQGQTVTKGNDHRIKGGGRPCALCHRRLPLCDSHLLPKAIYRLLRKKATSQGPVHFGDGYSYSTDKQVTDYLLCLDCEARFQRLGEGWVLRQCYRGESRFRLRSTIQSIAPDRQNADIKVYSLTGNPAITPAESEMLIYFAMSVFWRAGVHTWRYEGRRIGIDLGPYLEPIRLYLTGEAAFPPRVILVIRISSLVKLAEFMNAPEGRNENGFHFHSFTIPGLTFLLFVGGRLNEQWFELATAPTPARYVSISPNADITALMNMAAVRKKSA